MGTKKQLVVGDRVIKTGGDYVFQGFIVSVFRKIKGGIRYVVENDDGILHIFSPAQLVSIDKTGAVTEPEADDYEPGKE